MKKLILMLLTAIALAFAIRTAVHADSNCDSSDPGNVSITFE
jgi:hypothetical protein